MDQATDFASPAWLLFTIGCSPKGQLALHEGRLTFRVEEDVVFAATRSEIERVVFPWYYFSGGMQVWIGGKQFKLSFVKPNSAEVSSSLLMAKAGNANSLGYAVSKFTDAATGRTAGKQWRALLMPATKA